MTTPATKAAELPEALSVEAAYSGDKLIGYVLRTSGDPRPLLVWADQSVMTGFRMGDGFVPGFQETIDYRPMKLYAENEALRAQPAGAPRIPVANLIELHQGLADNLHDGPARNLHLATVEALRAQPAGAATPAAPTYPALPEADKVMHPSHSEPYGLWGLKKLMDYAKAYHAANATHQGDHK